MRLNKQIIEQAKREFHSMLENNRDEQWRYPLTTKDFIGTPHFHGERTLNSRQIHRILREMPDVVHDAVPCGPYQTYSTWELK